MRDREQLCKEFTELTGGHWHEWNKKPYYQDGVEVGLRCDCGLHCMEFKNITYLNPVDVINGLFNFLPTRKWHAFIEKEGCWHETKIQQGNDFAVLTRPYVPVELLTEDKLLKAAVEWLKRKG